MPRARPAIRASPSRRWLTLKSRYRNTRAKVKTTARARAVASILVKTRAKEREAAQPTEASRSNNQTLAAHIGTLASLASNDVLQRDLGKIPEAKPMDNNMKMDGGNMDHM